MTPSPCLLALDTSTLRGALALIVADRPTLAVRLDPEMRHGRALVPALRDVLAGAGLRPADLDGLAVGLGPGSYTGLRIGLTAAKTLAYALDRPLVGLDSLEMIAPNAPADAQIVSVIGDAQRGDLYVADFRRDAPGGPLVRSNPTRVVPFDAWAAALDPGTFVLGPAAGIARLAAQIPQGVRRPDDPLADWPDPTRLAERAIEAWASGRRDDPWFLEPVYLRRSAAEEQWERRPAS